MSIDDTVGVDEDKNYTTRQVAKICNVSPKIVLRLFDSGKLKGFRVPGSRHRRIPGKYLAEFINEHGIMGVEERVYTTGKVAKILSLCQQTIVRRFDEGEFEGGYKILGSNFRYIPHSSLIKFAEKYGVVQQLEDYFGIPAQDL